jgi:predicted Zn-dependent protease
LAQYRPWDARRALEHYRRWWIFTDDEQAMLLASQAARQDNDPLAAMAHLRHSWQSVGNVSPNMAFEWALLQASDGNVGSVANYLQSATERRPEREPLVWEAIAVGYLKLFRANDSSAVLERWLREDPENLRALELRGLAYIQGQGLKRGIEDLQAVLKRDADRPATQRQLALALLDQGQYREAEPYLRALHTAQPRDAELKVRLSRCLWMTEQPGEAKQLLSAVLDAEPDNWLAVRTQGQFALLEQQPALAVRHLRRAAELRPGDYLTQFLLLQALQTQGDREAIQAQATVVEATKAAAQRLTELQSRELAVRPFDPALHVEIGQALIAAGQNEAGVRWLQQALDVEPDYRPAHEALLVHYTQKNDTAAATRHRVWLEQHPIK